jgi:hypothetical protein
VKVRVYHGYYGCDTGCCGHIVELDDDRSRFEFTHPPTDKSRWREWAEDLVREAFGDEHVKDLDWGNCEIVDD